MRRNSAACVALVGMALLLAGCATQWGNGLPPDKWMIGGGPAIEWVPAERGTAIIADKTSGKIIMTKYLIAGGKLDFSIRDAKDFEEVMGVPLKDARIVAYFIPGSAQPGGKHGPP